MKRESNQITKRGHNKYLLELRELSRTNRKNPSPSEALLWNMVLSKRIMGYKFLRQKPINQFILDFYSPKLLLDIEIDGGYHLKQKNRDEGRDLILSDLGIKTIRYTDDVVIKNLYTVAADIRQQISLLKVVRSSKGRNVLSEAKDKGFSYEH